MFVSVYRCVYVFSSLCFDCVGRCERSVFVFLFVYLFLFISIYFSLLYIFLDFLINFA